MNEKRIRTLGQAPPPVDPAESEFQRIVGEWADETFPNATFLTIVTHLQQEEVPELVDDVVAQRNRVRENAADCLLLLLHLAHKLGFDLVSTAASKHAYNTTRPWETVDTSGRGYLKAAVPTTPPVGTPYTPGHPYPERVQFVDFLVQINARMSVDVTDTDFLEHRPDDTPEDLAEYLSNDFLWPTFLDLDQAFVGWSEVERIGTPVVLQRLSPPPELEPTVRRVK